MVRILGNNLPSKKKISLALTNIYGIGISTSLKILKKFNINPNLKVVELSNEDILNIKNFIEKQSLKLEGDLKRFIILNIQHLTNIHCFKGKRHNKGLPVRGQRTKTNSKTSRKLNIFAK